MTSDAGIIIHSHEFKTWLAYILPTALVTNLKSERPSDINLFLVNVPIFYILKTPEKGIKWEH